MSDSNPTRRNVLAGLLATSVAGVGGYEAWWQLRQPAMRVTTLRHGDYDADLAAHLVEGIKRYPHIIAKTKGGRVVLKPNFVEFHPPRPINTDVRFVAAAVEAFQRLGAKEVLVGEGPGHLRDTELLLEASGLGDRLRDAKTRFVDLNVDDGKRLHLPHNLTGFGTLDLAATAVTADVLVSLAKMKTHHWVGATLTMKNLFGLVPSAIYGWPKNPLHKAGIHESIVDIWSAVQPDFGIVDGIVGMEGDGPIMGTPKPMKAIIMGDHLPAVDATAIRLMGMEPLRMGYLANASYYQRATISAGRITVDGDAIAASPFELLPMMQHLRA